MSFRPRLRIFGASKHGEKRVTVRRNADYQEPIRYHRLVLPRPFENTSIVNFYEVKTGLLRESMKRSLTCNPLNS